MTTVHDLPAAAVQGLGIAAFQRAGAPHHGIPHQAYAVHAGGVFQHREHSRAVSILGGLARFTDDRRFAGKGVILLHKAALGANGLHQLLPQLGNQLIHAVIFQRTDGTLIGQRFSLAAPVVGGHVAEQRVVGGHAGQRHFGPELLRVQQVLLDKALRQSIRQAVPIHAAQRVVDQGGHLVVVFVAVKHRAAGIVPQVAHHLVLHGFGLGGPLGLCLGIAADSCNFRQCFAAGI